MTKYKLKKDTPEFKTGEVFEMIHNVDVGYVLTQNAPRQDMYAFDVDSVDNFDEWFEEVEEENKPLFSSTYFNVFSTSTIYYVKVQFECNQYENAEERRDEFSHFLGAVNTVSMDDGFMKPSFRIQNAIYGHSISTNEHGDIKVFTDGNIVTAGELFFDTVEHAKASVDKHENEWRTILNYKWGKGEKEQDEN